MSRTSPWGTTSTPRRVPVRECVSRRRFRRGVLRLVWREGGGPLVLAAGSPGGWAVGVLRAVRGRRGRWGRAYMRGRAGDLAVVFGACRRERRP